LTTSSSSFAFALLQHPGTCACIIVDILHALILLYSFCLDTKRHNTNTHHTSQHTMGREDQQEEREVLDSIFPDEITGTTIT
jgi:hypothetical protein